MKILLLAISLTVLTVMLHSVGTYLVIAHFREWQSARMPWAWMRTVGTMGFLVIFLLLLHLAEAALWAAVLFWWETLPDFTTALYYSLTSYSTVGYGDVLLPESARLLGPIESVLGVMMLGWSTAVIVAVVHRVFGDAVRSDQVASTRSHSSADGPINTLQEPDGP